MMRDIGSNFEGSLIAGMGGSKKLEQKDSVQQGDFNNVLTEKETEQDKTEKKEMKYQEIEREESQQEVNKKDYDKFLERQNLLFNNPVVVNVASQQQMANNMPNTTAFTQQINNKSVSSRGNQAINNGQVGLQDLQKLMSQRGIAFTQLNTKQMAKLYTVHSRTEVTSFLNELAKELRNDKNEKNLNNNPLGMHGDNKLPKTEIVNQSGEKKNSGNNPDEKDDSEKLQAASGAADKMDKLNGTPLSQFFQSAKLSEFQQGSPMEQKIMKQIMDKMELNTEKAKSEVAIKLNPEYLGDVRLNMVVDKDKGTVSINFKTTSKTAKKALEGNVGSLQEAFAAAGLKVEKFDVSLDDELA